LINFGAQQKHMNTSTIRIDVETDEKRLPSTIRWSATDSTAGGTQEARAMILSLWDGSEKAALRIDLWTREMMVDEMADFFYQTLMTMADTYGRATQHDELVSDMKDFARSFYKKFREKQLREHKA